MINLGRTFQSLWIITLILPLLIPNSNLFIQIEFDFEIQLQISFSILRWIRAEMDSNFSNNVEAEKNITEESNIEDHEESNEETSEESIEAQEDISSSEDENGDELPEVTAEMLEGLKTDEGKSSFKNIHLQT